MPEFGRIQRVSPMLVVCGDAQGDTPVLRDPISSNSVGLESTDYLLLWLHPVVFEHSQFHGSDANDRVVRLCARICLRPRVYHTNCTILLSYSGDTPNVSHRVA